MWLGKFLKFVAHNLWYTMLPSTQLNQSVSQSGSVSVSLVLFDFYAFRWQGNLSNSTNARKSLCCLSFLFPSLDFTPSQSKPSSSLTLFTSDMVYHTTPHSLPLCRGRVAAAAAACSFCLRAASWHFCAVLIVTLDRCV